MAERQRVYLKIDKKLHKNLLAIKKSSNYDTLNELLEDVLEDYVLSSSTKFKYQDRISLLIQNEFTTLTKTMLNALEIIDAEIDEKVNNSEIEDDYNEN